MMLVLHQSLDYLCSFLKDFKKQLIKTFIGVLGFWGSEQDAEESELPGRHRSHGISVSRPCVLQLHGPWGSSGRGVMMTLSSVKSEGMSSSRLRLESGASAWEINEHRSSSGRRGATASVAPWTFRRL